jgi:hypothetical protein
LNRYLVRIEVPDDLYDARRVLDPPPVGWDAESYGLPSVGLGDEWAASNSAALLDVPSVISKATFPKIVVRRVTYLQSHIGIVWR